MRRPFIKNVKTIVIKVGTSVLTRGGRFDRRRINELAGQVSRFLKKGVRVSIVSSGAIGAGMTILKLKNRPKAMEALQASAAAGQRYLMQCYEEAFSKNGFSTAQVLLTWDDLAEEKRFLNAKRTLKQIQKWGLVPVINENDTVATDEIRFGDNDRLSSLLAILIEADLLVILSDTDGLYADGDRADAGKRLSLVRGDDDSIFSHVKDRQNAFTVGGMNSKLRAVRIATSSGVPVVVANGQGRDVLRRIFDGKDVGTFFMPHHKQVRNRQNWIRHFVTHIKN
ncbi:MAG: glutamate 5-kinase [Polyangiaceae bacterium]